MFTSIRLKLKTILSLKAVSIAIVLVAVAARVIQLLFFYNIRVDASYQVMATDNFIHGHGISIAAVNPLNLSQTIYQPLTNWPPGYSLLLAPFYILFNHNYIAAGLCLDIIMAVLLIIVCRKILRLLDIPVYLINTFTLLNGFFIYYFYFIASSDAIAIAFFLLALYYCIKFLKKAPRYLLNVLLMTFFLFVAALIKYLFMPVVFVIPGFLIMKGYIEKDAKIRNRGIASFLLLAGALTAVLIHQATATESVAYISSPSRGFFPEHLLDIYPFMLSSFINPDTIAILTKQQSGGNSFSYRFLQLIQLLIIGACLLYFFNWAWKSKFKNMSARHCFFCMALFTSIAITNVLMILSLQVTKEEILPGYFWTYVEEPRYYGLINVLSHLAVFVVYRMRLYTGSLFKKYLFYGLLLLLIPELGRSAYFHFNRIRLFGKEEYSWQIENRLQKYADSIIQQVKKEKPSVQVIVGGSFYYYSHRFSLYSHVPVLYDSSVLANPHSLQAEKPVVVVAMFANKTSAEQKDSIYKREKPVGRFENFLFYSIYVAPK